MEGKIVSSQIQHIRISKRGSKFLAGRKPLAIKDIKSHWFNNSEVEAGLNLGLVSVKLRKKFLIGN